MQGRKADECPVMIAIQASKRGNPASQVQYLTGASLALSHHLPVCRASQHISISRSQKVQFDCSSFQGLVFTVALQQSSEGLERRRTNESYTCQGRRLNARSVLTPPSSHYLQCVHIPGMDMG